MAASQAFLVLLSVSFMQAAGISIGVSTLVGRYIGAGDLPSAERSYRSGIKLGWALALTIALLFLLIPGTLMRIFSDEPGILSVARPLLLVGAVFQLFDALAQIRAQESLNAIPVVAMTANATESEGTRYIEAGFDAFLAKPIDSGKLDGELERFLSPRAKA